MSCRHTALVFTIALLLTFACAGFASASSGVAHSTSTDRWAGYYESHTAISEVGGTWRVPSLHCGSATTFSSTWVGVGGLDGSVLLQAGLFDNCVSGIAENGAFAESYPGGTQSFDLLLRAGDRITSTVEKVNGQWVATVVDDTTHQRERANASGYAGGGTAEWMLEAYGEPTYPLSDVGSIRFASLTVDGAPARPRHSWSLAGGAGTVTAEPPVNGYRLIYGG